MFLNLFTGCGGSDKYLGITPKNLEFIGIDSTALDEVVSVAMTAANKINF